MYFSTFNTKRIDANKKAMFNTEGVSASQFIMIFPLFLAPIIIYLPFGMMEQKMMGLLVVGGVGVGGGSLVYAAVLLEPKDAFYSDPSWSHLGVDWKKELHPHYQTATKMLGVTENPKQTEMDRYLKETARRMEVEGTYGAVQNGIFFLGGGLNQINDPLLAIIDV